MAKRKHKKIKHSNGIATTGNKPFKNHPAGYKKSPGGKDDEIIFQVFTHSEYVNELNTTTFPLRDNIKPNEKGTSHVVPKVYVGNRSQLNKNIKGAKLSKSNKDFINYLFEILPVVDVRNKNIQNTKRNKKQKKR